MSDVTLPPLPIKNTMLPKTWLTRMFVNPVLTTIHHDTSNRTSAII
jgi:hypothetical protein